MFLEVYEWVRERGEDAALQAAALMQQGGVIDLDVSIATRAAKPGIHYELPLAESVILVTAVTHELRFGRRTQILPLSLVIGIANDHAPDP